MLRGSLRSKAEQGPVFGCAIHIPSPELVEAIGLLGFDYVMIDAEQGQMSVETCTEMVRAANAVGVSPVIRIAYHDPRLLNRYLNTGAIGVMVPHVKTAAEARALVANTKFAPVGQRSFATHARASGYGLVHKSDYYQEMANRETMIFVIIEDMEGVENLPEILKVDGIDVFGVGMRDLSTSLGYQGQWNHPKVQEIVERIFEQVLAAGRHMWQGGTSDEELALRPKRFEQGVRFFSVGWLDLVTRSARQFLKF